jgi:hypothetical protein
MRMVVSVRPAQRCVAPRMYSRLRSEPAGTHLAQMESDCHLTGVHRRFCILKLNVTFSLVLPPAEDYG